MIVSEFTLQKREDATSGGCCIDHESLTVEQHVYGLVSVYGASLLTVTVSGKLVYWRQQ